MIIYLPRYLAQGVTVSTRTVVGTFIVGQSHFVSCSKWFVTLKVTILRNYESLRQLL